MWQLVAQKLAVRSALLAMVVVQLQLGAQTAVLVLAVEGTAPVAVLAVLLPVEESTTAPVVGGLGLSVAD